MRNKPCLTTEDVQRVCRCRKKHARKFKRSRHRSVDEGGICFISSVRTSMA